MEARYSYTDYYTNTAPTGSLGQKQYVYDPKNAGFYLDATITPPPGTASADYWKYQLKPSNANSYSGAFAYDGNGRVTNVWKLQKTTTNPWTYVQTQMTYGLDGTPTWGQATVVVEDAGGIARTTQNQAYTSWGKPCAVLDAAGNYFYTSYDNDGNVEYVSRTFNSRTPSVVSYTYGTSGLTNGVPTQVVDGLTGVTQNLTYQNSGGGLGQISQVSQSGGLNPSYSVTYGYDSAGDRATASYATADGTISWQYGDYVEVGTANNPRRAFQTLTKLNGPSLTAEEMHYQYDSAGRLSGAAFAQTPFTGFTPSGSNPWYDSSHPAQSRVRAFYAHDAGGRMLSCEHYWDTLTSGSTTYGTSQTILANECVYDPTLGLKTSSSFYTQTLGTPTTWTQTRQEAYGYDPQLDYLTSASYGDGLGNATWSYDAAGNRTDSVCDNLNRTTSISGTSVTCDILGDRTALGSSTTYSWDFLSRLTGLTTSGMTSSYEYRADGMRSHKTVGSTSTEYYHDAQMPMEDAVYNGSSYTVTRYGLGARGIDYEEVGAASSRPLTTFSNVGFPIYDAHGNMVATLARSGTNSYVVNNQRSYDAWGVIRIGSTSGDPKNRYCGNLGPQQDDESGLIYVRARYYESTSGRFLSQDPNGHGKNWLVYCSNNPVNLADPTGQSEVDPNNYNLFQQFEGILILSSLSACLMALARNLGLYLLCITIAVAAASVCLGCTNVNMALVAWGNFASAVIGAVLSYYAWVQTASANAVTAVLAGVMTVTLCADLAALSTLNDNTS